jgi:hypothetical protein
MPFHDYYAAPPDILPLPTAPLLGAIALPVALLALALVGWLTGMETVPLIGFLWGWAPGPTALVALALTAIALVSARRVVLARGAQPFPPPEGANLPGVLKALYLQQRFGDFVAAHQGRTPDALHKAFGEFLSAHRPEDDAEPTQPPGVLRSAAPKKGRRT